VGGALTGRTTAAGRFEHRAALAGLLVIVSVIGWGLPTAAKGPQSAQVRLSENGAVVHIAPPGGVDDAHFLNITAWQGGSSVISELERTGPGEYRSAQPVPVSGAWKTLVRLHVRDSLVGVPIYLPRDRAISAPAVPAEPQVTRAFVSERQILQRERKQGVAGGLSALAYLAVAGLAAALIALVAWVLLRLERGRNPGAVMETDRTAHRPQTTSPRHLLDSPPRRVRGNAERGNQGWSV
jgi:hypothetical protein